MKKIFTLVLSLFAVSSFAQSVFSARESDDVTPMAASYDFYLAPMDPTLEEHFHLFNLTSNTIGLKINKYVVNNVAGADIYFCCGTQCFGPSTMTSNVNINGSSSLPNGQGTYGLKTQFDPGPNTGTSTVKYSIINLANPSDSVQVTINYHVTAVGINNVSLNSVIFSNAYPNPVNKTAAINFDTKGIAEKFTCKVFNMLGAQVKEIKIEEAEGKITIDANEFGNGIYFFSLYVNQKAITTKRVVIAK